MDLTKESEDELLGLDSTSTEVINVSCEAEKAKDLEEELLLLSSPSPTHEASSSFVEPPDKPHHDTDGKSLNLSAKDGLEADLTEITDESEDNVVDLEEERTLISNDSEGEEKEVISDDSETEKNIVNEDDDSVLEIEDDSMLGEIEDSVLEGKISIFHCGGAFFVWNADDAQMLREECRIIGKLTGCLPRAPRQNNHLGLPLQLMPEEAKLLVDIDAATLVEEDCLSDTVLKAREKAFKIVREENFKIQQRLYKESRKEEVRQRMDQIIEGKKAKKRKLATEKGSQEEKKPGSGEGAEGINAEKKAQEMEASEKDEDKQEKDDEENLGVSGTGAGENDIPADPEDKLTVDDIVTSETSAKHSFVQIFTENPWKRGIRPYTGWKFPETEQEAIRYTVFKDLWKKGYYLTSGSKFGGDFLVYPGDPCRFHSHFIAVCVNQNYEMSVLDLVSLGRLASNVRKVTLLCSLSNRRRVSYTSLQWTGIS